MYNCVSGCQVYSVEYWPLTVKVYQLVNFLYFSQGATVRTICIMYVIFSDNVCMVCVLFLPYIDLVIHSVSKKTVPVLFCE